MKTAPSRDDLTEALLDSASEILDRSRSRTLVRFRKAGLSAPMAHLSLLAALTEAAERCAPAVPERKMETPALAGNAVPFRLKHR